MTSFRPPTADSLADVTSTLQRCVFRVARVHAEDFGRKQRRFVAARAGADFQHDVLFVVRILGQQQNLQFLFDLGKLRLEPRDFVAPPSAANSGSVSASIARASRRS